MKKVIIDEEEFDKLHKLIKGGKDDLLMFFSCLKAYTSNKNKIQLCFLIRECCKAHSYIVKQQMLLDFTHAKKYDKPSIQDIYDLITTEDDYKHFALYANKIYMGEIKSLLGFKIFDLTCSVKNPLNE